MGKRLYKSKNTLNKILTAAEKEFSKNGFDKTTVRDVAKEACVNVAMIYYYFNTKKGLYDHVLDNGFEKLSSEIKKRLCGNKGPYEKIYELISTYVGFFRSNRDMLNIILRETVSGAGDIDRIVTKYISKYFNYHKLIIIEGIEMGIFRDIEPGFAILSLMGMIFYFFNYEPIYTRLIDLKEGDDFYDSLPNHIYSIYMNGIAKPKKFCKSDSRFKQPLRKQI